MFTLEDIKYAYAKLGVKPCRAAFFKEGECCPLSAMYLVENGIDFNPNPTVMLKMTDDARDILDYFTKKYGYDNVIQFYFTFDNGRYGTSTKEAINVGKEAREYFNVQNFLS